MPLPPAILVVEDSPPLRESLQEILELAGYAVLAVGSATEGLHSLRMVEPQPQLIITDIMLPDMGGLELFQQVRAQPQWQQIPFIFISGNQEKLDAVRSVVGSDRIAYLFKPFGIQELLDTVAHLL